MAKKNLTRKQRSRLEREAYLRKLLFGGLALVAVIVIGVLAYGIVTELIIKGRQPVAVVDGEPIATVDFQSRVKFQRAQMENQLQMLYMQQQQMDPEDESSQFYLSYLQNQIQQIQEQLAPENAVAVGDQVLEQMIQEELVRQEAERRDITVSEDEVQETIEGYFGYEPGATPVPTLSPAVTTTEEMPAPTPTEMTEEDFRQMYNQYVQETLGPLGVSEQQYRSWIEASLLMEKLQQRMAEEAPAEVDQVKVRLLSVPDEERANALVSRLDDGEDFQVLMDELQADEEGGGYGTELDWLPQDMLADRLDDSLADRAFDLDVGEHSQPLKIETRAPQMEGEESPTQFAIIEVIGHEVRALDEELRQQLGQQAFQSWLESQQVLVERKSYQDVVPTDS